MNSLKKILVFLIVIGLAGSASIAYLRGVAERSSRVVELVCDYDEVYEFSQEYGGGIDELLKDMRLSGMCSVAIGEETLRSLSASGRVLILNGTEMQFFASGYVINSASKKGYTYIIFEDPDLWENSLLWLKLKLGEERVITGNKTGYNPGWRYRLIAVDIKKKALLRNIGLGFRKKRWA